MSKPIIQFHSNKTVTLTKDNYSAKEVYEIICLIFSSGAVDWKKLEEFLNPQGTVH